MQRAFAYRARDQAGRLREGEVWAESAQEAARQVHGGGCLLVYLREKNPWWRRLQNAAFPLRGNQRRWTAWLFHRLAVFMEAGVPLLQALEILQKGASAAAYKELLTDVCGKIRQGESLHRALRKAPAQFSPLCCEMIEVGEKGGILSASLELLAGYLEQKEQAQEKLRSAMLYPLFVMSFACIVVSFLIFFVLPIFTSLFASMQIALPLPTRLVLGGAAYLQEYGRLLAASLGICAVFCWRAQRSPRYGWRLHMGLWRIPIFGTYLLAVQTGRFARLLAMLLRGGIPLLTALQTIENAAENPAVRRMLKDMEAAVQGGMAVAASLKAATAFPELLIEMALVGEASGKLDIMLEQAADFYEADVILRMERFTVLLEPVLTVVVGAIVGGIVMAVALPMLDFAVRLIG